MYADESQRRLHLRKSASICGLKLDAEDDSPGWRGVADDFLVFLVCRVFDFHEWREAGEAVLDVRVDRGVGAVGSAGEGEDGQRVFAFAGVEDDDVRVDRAAAIAGGE